MCFTGRTWAAAAITCRSNAAPPISCSTLGRCDRKRVPLPAAMIRAAKEQGTTSAGDFPAGNGLERVIERIVSLSCLTEGVTPKIHVDSRLAVLLDPAQPTKPR